MPKRKTSSDQDPAAAAPYNPLRDHALLGNASQDLAKHIIASDTKMTAMAFCVRVLQSLGLDAIAIGQAERILISSMRKSALGCKDNELIIKPPTAAPVRIPRLVEIAESLSMREASQGLLARGEPLDLVSRLRMAFDADALFSSSLVHIESFLTSPEISQISQDLASGGASDDRVTALRESSGTGCKGAYSDVTVSKAALLGRLNDALRTVLLEKAQCRTLGKKVLLTRYAEGGINWAHQDQCDGPYQAYLLLSRPGVE